MIYATFWDMATIPVLWNLGKYIPLKTKSVIKLVDKKKKRKKKNIKNQKNPMIYKNNNTYDKKSKNKWKTITDSGP